MSPKAARRLRAGYPWIYRQDVMSPPEAPSGAVVRITDASGNFIGLGFWAVHSPLALRLLTRREEKVDASFFRQRLADALERRKRQYPGDDAYRVVHGEADLLPGLFVDRYGSAVTVQVISEGMAAREAELVEALDGLLSPTHIALRNDTAARDFEGLPRTTALAKGASPALATFHEGENVFEIDLLADSKTGSFLDQKENHVRATAYARGRGLDTFGYHGGFALALARGCEHVLSVDQNEAATARAQANVARNGLKNVEVRTANAFDLLRQLEAADERFDVIVVDPPAFAKRKEGLGAAERAYKELNL
ncbi:MAG: class I SAM-dependent rRNA methyltransferase, partial [Myxococcales bacterium]